MKRSSWIVALCVAALIGTMACDSDDVVDAVLPASAQAEALLESAFADVVEPVSGLIDGLGDLLSNPKAGPVTPPSVECPNTTTVCSSGTLTCDADSSGLNFDFDTCDVALDPVIVDGAVLLTPTGETSFILTLDTVSFNSGSPMSGTLEIDGAACSQDWVITTADGVGLLAAVVSCDGPPAAGSTLTITFTNGSDYWVATFTFDGTDIADVTVTRNSELVSTCEMNMETYEATCMEI